MIKMGNFIRWRSLSIVSILLLATFPAWAEPVAPGFDVEVYANLPDPGQLAFDPAGILYAGHIEWQAKIYRIGIGGNPVEAYGDEPITAPEGVAFDASGAISGVPGSVLVSHFSGWDTEGYGYRGGVKAILPDQSTKTVSALEAAIPGPRLLRFDRTGRLLIAGHFGSDWPYGISATTGESLVGFGEEPHGLAVDGANCIYASIFRDAIKVYSPDGRELRSIRRSNDGGSDVFYSLDFGPYDPIWQGHLFVACDSLLDDQDTKIVRIMPDGQVIPFATGFHPDTNMHLAFGPDGALFVSARGEDAIYRISPSDTPSETIIDNTDSGFYSGPGFWPTSTYISGYYGGNYQYAEPGDGLKWASWSFPNNRRCVCEIYGRWVTYFPGTPWSRSPEAPYTILNNDVEIGTATADHGRNNGQFVLLGTFDLEPGMVEIVLNDVSSGYVIADAVKIVSYHR